VSPDPDHKPRCPWCGTDPLYTDYHDREWGVPLRDDRALFELLILEGFQAGLSWHTILKRREGFREAFAGFDPEVLATYGPNDHQRLLADPRIIRNRLKVLASTSNARAYLRLRDSGLTLSDYLWGFVDNRPIVNRFQSLGEVPATTPLSDAIGKDLKKKGFTFVGSTIVYAFMQSIGMVNDHLTSCFRHAELTQGK